VWRGCEGEREKERERDNSHVRNGFCLLPISFSCCLPLRGIEEKKEREGKREIKNGREGKREIKKEKEKERDSIHAQNGFFALPIPVACCVRVHVCWRGWKRERERATEWSMRRMNACRCLCSRVVCLCVCVGVCACGCV